MLNEELSELEPACRLLFIGLWCLADRDGFLKHRPKRIWAEIFPYNQALRPKVGPWLDELEKAGFIRYWYKTETIATKHYYNEPLDPMVDLGVSKATQENGEKKSLKSLTTPSEPAAIEIINFLKHQRPHQR